MVRGRSEEEGKAASQGGGGVFKNAAVEVLAEERRLMTTGDITRVALERGKIQSQGKTPEATMASALYTDVKRKAEKSAFTRPQEGLFGLRAWIDEGFYPDGWGGRPGSSGDLAPFKKRNSSNPGRTRRPAGRAAKGRAQASWQASEDQDEEASGVADEHEYEDGGEGSGAGTQPGMAEDAEDSSFKSPVPTNRLRSALSVRAANSGEATSEGHHNMSAPQQQPHEQQHSHLQPHPQQQQQQEQQSHAGMLDLGHLGRSDPGLESPLHVLGDAALNTSGRGAPARVNTSGKRPRKKPTGLGIQVPEGSTGSGRVQDTPKSPYSDSLAALHEIATSPHPYAGNGGNSAEVNERRIRQRLSVDPERALAGPAGNPQGAPYIMHVPVLAPPQGGFLGAPATQVLRPQHANLLQLQGVQAWRPGGAHSLQGLVNVMPFQPHDDALLQGQGYEDERLAEASMLLRVAERLEARLGKQNAQVGKAWMAASRMFQSLGEASGDAALLHQSCAAVKRAREVCLEAARAVGSSCQCEAEFGTLQERLDAKGRHLAGTQQQQQQQHKQQQQQQQALDAHMMRPPPPRPAAAAK